MCRRGTAGGRTGPPDWPFWRGEGLDNSGDDEDGYNHFGKWESQEHEELRKKKRREPM